MSRLLGFQANFGEAQANYYRCLEDMEDGEIKLQEILDRLIPKPA